METKSDVWQDSGIFVDLIYCKHQDQDMLVELGHHTVSKDSKIWQ